jgi:hypothetical protein
MMSQVVVPLRPFLTSSTTLRAEVQRLRLEQDTGRRTIRDLRAAVAARDDASCNTRQRKRTHRRMLKLSLRCRRGLGTG